MNSIGVFARDLSKKCLDFSCQIEGSFNTSTTLKYHSSSHGKLWPQLSRTWWTCPSHLSDWIGFVVRFPLWVGLFLSFPWWNSKFCWLYPHFAWLVESPFLMVWSAKTMQISWWCGRKTIPEWWSCYGQASQFPLTADWKADLLGGWGQISILLLGNLKKWELGKVCFESLDFGTFFFLGGTWGVFSNNLNWSSMAFVMRIYEELL